MYIHTQEGPTTGQLPTITTFRNSANFFTAEQCAWCTHLRHVVLAIFGVINAGNTLSTG
eukprot:m.159400 g.159400  ORF g.159400 m.159400 type:complete len:59 (-) comp18004_c0_seq1:2221-2397(-)